MPKVAGVDDVDFALLDDDETFLTAAQLKKKKIMKMKLKKTIDMKVDGPKKTKILEDGTEVTDNDDEDEEYDQEEYDDEEEDIEDSEEQEFVPPQFVFKDSSIRDTQKNDMDVVLEEESPDVKHREENLENDIEEE